MACACGIGMNEADVQALIDVSPGSRPGPTVMVTSENGNGTTQRVFWRRLAVTGTPGVYEWFDEFGAPVPAPPGVFAPSPIRVAVADTAAASWADDLMTLWGLAFPVDFDVFDATGNDLPYRMLKVGAVWFGVGAEEADVPNLAALRLVSYKAAGPVVRRLSVAGHTLPGDGGQGLFRWDGPSTVTDDNGWHIDPGGAGPGRWVREGSSVTPHMFGAAGFHQTAAAASAGVDNIVPIQAMLTFWANRPDIDADFLGLHWRVSAPVLLTANLNPRVDTRGPRLRAGTFVAAAGSSGDALVEVRMPHGHIAGRLTAIGTGGINFDSRTWRTGVRFAYGWHCQVEHVVCHYFRRYGVDIDDRLGGHAGGSGSNVGLHIGHVTGWYCGPCHPTHPNAGIGINSASTFTAHTRTGSANSFFQGSVLTLAAPPPPELAVGDVVLIATNLDPLEPHYVRAIAGNDVTVFPWIDAAQTTGTLNWSYGAAADVVGGESASTHIGMVEAVSSATGLHHRALYGPMVDRLQTQFCTTGLTLGTVGPDGTSPQASLMGSVGYLYNEGGPATIWSVIGLSASVDAFKVVSGLYMGGTDPTNTANEFRVDPFGGMWQVSPKTVSGERTTTFAAVRGTFQTIAGALVTERLGSRAGHHPTAVALSNRPGQDELIHTHANAPTLTLSWDPSLDRNRAGHTVIKAMVTGTAAGNAPSGNVTVAVSAADLAAGVTIMGGTGPVLFAGAALGAPMVVTAVMLVTPSTGARDWRVFASAL